MNFKKFSAKPLASNTDVKQTYRVIGSLDIDGNGTEHALADVDPFVFLDETILAANATWPFPNHPHCGLVAMTYMLAGDVQPWDNHQGKNASHNKAGGIYYINSGYGIVHEEEPIHTGKSLRWLQLWLNPGMDSENLPHASSQLVEPKNIPVHETSAGFVRIIIGEAFQKKSPLQPDRPMQYLHVMLKPQHTLQLQIPASNWQGFIYLLNGSGEFSEMNAHARDCLVFQNVEVISAKNSHSSDTLEFVLVSGLPVQQPFYKLACGGGSLILETEAAVRAAKQRFEQDSKNFGF